MRSPGLTKCLLVSTLFVELGCLNVEAAEWEYTAEYPGHLTIWGTINCDPTGDPLFDGDVVADGSYSGLVPLWANDYLVKFEVDPSYCPNKCEEYKVKVARFDWTTGSWMLEPLAEWMDGHLFEPFPTLPVIMDVGGDISSVYMVVNLDEWLAEEPALLPEYFIEDGRHPDLPGYLIGTTPLQYDPYVGPNDDPFSTTPLTGRLDRAGLQTFTPEPATLLLLVLGGLVVPRRGR